MAMTISELHAKLINSSPLKLTISDDTDNAFRWLLFGLNVTELNISNHAITQEGDVIIIRGSVSFGNPTGIYNLAMRIIAAPPETERTFTVELTANAPVSGSISDVFGTIYPTFHPKNGIADYDPLLDDIEISGVMTIDYSDDQYSELPLRFSCTATLPTGKPWTDERFLVLFGAAGATGTLSGNMLPNHAFGDTKFSASLELASTEMKYFNDLLPLGDSFTAFIGLQNGVSGLDDPVADASMRHMFVSRVFAGLRFKLKGLSDGVELTAPIFRGGEYLCVGADFGTGLSPADMVNFLANLFRNVPHEHLMLPQKGFLDSFGLRNFSVTLHKQENTEFPSILALSAYVSSKNEIKLPINGLILNSIDLQFIIQWGYDEAKRKLNALLTASDASSYLITCDIGAKLTFPLPNGKTGTLIANATLPDMEFVGTLKIPLKSNDKNHALAPIMGDVANALPNVENIPTLTIRVAAGYTSRTLALDASITNAIKFPIGIGGKIELLLKEFDAGAMFTQSGNHYYIGGNVGFSGKAIDDFSLSLRAAYGNGAWLFEGGLSSGEVSLTALLVALGFEAKSALDAVKLTEFWMRYRYKSGGINPLSLRAVITADLKDTFNFTLKGSAAFALETDENGNLTASVLAALEAGNFDITAQLDGLGTDRSSFIFTFLFRGKGIRAALFSDADGKKFLAMQLQNISLGDIIQFLVGLVRNDFDSTLPAPLDLLYKIDLSKFTLTYGISDKSLALEYALNLNLGIVKIKSLGLKYIDDGLSGADVRMILAYDSKIQNSNNETGDSDEWSLLNETPPLFGSAGSLAFNLDFMGLFVHFDNANEKIVTVNDIATAVTLMRKKPSTFSPTLNFAFGAKFDIKKMLNVQIALVDPRIYGIHVEVSNDASGILAQFKELYLELFYKRISDDLGMFHASLMVPAKFRKFELGAISVTLGLITLEIYTDGSFYVDLGFPHNCDFSCSFALQFGTFTGRAGLYFGLLSGAAAQDELPASGRYSAVIKAGIGVTFGIGRSFNFGIVSGGFELSAAGVFEGIVAFPEEGSRSYYKLSAIIGIIGRVYVKVDLKIIVLSASVEFAAFAQAVFETDKATLIDLDLKLKLHGQVKILFIKVNFSYEFQYHAHFELGGSRKSILVLPSKDDVLLRANNVTIPWFLCHAQTINNTTAFVPMITKDNFKSIYDMAVDICKTIAKLHTGDITKDIAEAFDSNFVNKALSYEKLLDVITQNGVTFEITAQKGSSKEEIDGYVIALPPCVTLKITGAATDKIVEEGRNFSGYNPISKSYADTIAGFIGNAGTDELEKNIDEPIAQIVFVDYFRTLARQIFGEIRGLFRNYKIPAGWDTFADLGEKYGVTPLEIAEANSHLELKSGTEIKISQLFITREVLSFDDLSKIFPTVDLWAQLSESHILANTLLESIQLKKDATDIVVSTRIGGTQHPPLHGDGESIVVVEHIGRDFFAALVFVRWYGHEITTHWQKLYGDFLFEWKLSPDWEVTEPNSPALSIEIDGIRYNYTLQIGDTVERIAKMFTLVISPEGYFPAFDKFLSDVKYEGGFCFYSASDVAVFSAETPAQLARRLFQNSEPITTHKIIAQFAALSLNEVAYTVGENRTLQNFTEENGLEYSIVAEALRQEHFAEPESLTITPSRIPSSEIVAYLECSEDLCANTATFASRVLVQGLRLPTEDKDNPETIAFFELYGLQYELSKDEYIATITANDENAWVVGSESYPVSVSDEQKAPDALMCDSNITIEEIEPFAEINAVHPVSEKFLCGNNSVIRYLPQTQKGDSFTLHYADGTNVDCETALCLPFTVVRESGNVLRVVGLSPSDRIKIFPLIDSSNLTFETFYKPSQLSGLSGVLQSTNFGEHERFIKTNLSQETKLVLRQSNDISNYATDLSSFAFVKMLWECSITCGEYALYMTDANRIPSDVFDENNTAQLFLILYGVENANCVKSGDVANINKDAYFVNVHQKIAKPTLPSGSYGLRIKYKPNTDSVSQILSYTVETKGKESQLSHPLIPLESGTDEILLYEPMFPIGKNVYDNFGMATVRVYLTDIFGNQAPEPQNHYISYRVNDFLVPLNDLFGLKFSYKIESTKGRDNLTVVISADKNVCENGETVNPISGDALAKLQYAETQYRESNAKLFISSTLLDGEHDLGNSFHNFLAELITYHEGEPDAVKPNDIRFSCEIKNMSQSAFPDAIFPIEVTLGLHRRNAKTVAQSPAEVTHTTTAVPYESGEFSDKNFALAYKNLSDTTIFAVNLAKCFGTPQIDAHAIGSPRYFAQKPLANSSVDGADINLWGQLFLDDFENVILSNIDVLGQCEKSKVSALLSVKENLAEKISNTFIHAGKGSVSMPSDVKKFAKDMFLKNLDAEISSIAAYSVNGTEGIETRLVPEFSRTDTERVNFKSGKISASDEFLIAYTAFLPYETGFNVKYSPAAVQHFEGNIRNTKQGYESSDWFSFLTPQEIKSFVQEAKNIPNPLREIPVAPKLADSRFETVVENISKDSNTPNLSLCIYKFDVSGIAAGQDIMEFRVEINPQMNLREINSGIYTALKNYMDKRDKFVTELATDNVAEFIGFAKEICENWVEPSEPEDSGIMMSEASYFQAIKGTLKWEKSGAGVGYLTAHTEDGDWKVSALCEETEFGKPFAATVMVECAAMPLNVYDYTSAIPYVKTIRNADFSDDFIFQTEEISLPEVTAQNNFVEPVKLRTSGDWSDERVGEKINNMCEEFYNALDISAQAGLLAELSYLYKNTHGTAYVKIPVAMFKNASLQEIQGKAKGWFAKVSPVKTDAMFEFSARVYSNERCVISAQRILVS